MYGKEKQKILAYRVVCYKNAPAKDGVVVEISLKSLKNRENICARCKERRRCNSYMKGKYRVKFYDALRANIKRELPIEVSIRR